MSHSKTLGLSDIIGPIMVGPSSSHTAGALRIALMAHELMGRPPKEMRFTLYGSFAHTYRGHGTDRALVAGLLGFRPDDLRIRDSFEIARAQGISFDFQADSKTKPRHPNTVDVWVRDAAGEVLSVRGESIGGGAARLTRVDGIKVEITGEYSAAIIYQQDMPGVLGFVASTLGDAGINIGNSTILRERKGGLAYNVLEVDSTIPDEVQQVLLKDPRVLRIRFISAFSLPEGAGAATPRYTPEEAQELFPKLDYQDGTSILAHAYTCNISLGRAFLDREELLLAMQGKDMSGTYAYLDRVLQVMRESVKAPLEHGMHTMGGLIGGEAHALMQLCAGDGESHPSDKLHQIFSGVFPKAAAYAMAVLETNASMGRIVAAPTAGSAGVLPGVIAALSEAGDFSQEELRDALANAAAIGYIVTRNATVAGAEGGCQAEIGTASAMAASAATQLLGGSPQQCLAAAAIALTSLLGLVCDPVAGLVEEPCQKRNASAAANALVSCELALAGIHSTAFFDETVDALKRVGHSLPFELRETALGGIATCESCLESCRKAPHGS